MSTKETEAPREESKAKHMTPADKIRSLLNPRLREIHQTINGSISMGDLAVYVGQPISDAMAELADWMAAQDKERHAELLEALKELREATAACFRVIYRLGESAVDDLGRELQTAEIKDGFGVRAQNAIAKAEGQ